MATLRIDHRSPAAYHQVHINPLCHAPGRCRCLMVDFTTSSTCEQSQAKAYTSCSPQRTLQSLEIFKELAIQLAELMGKHIDFKWKILRLDWWKKTWFNQGKMMENHGTTWKSCMEKPINFHQSWNDVDLNHTNRSKKTNGFINLDNSRVKYGLKTPKLHGFGFVKPMICFKPVAIIYT